MSKFIIYVEIDGVSYPLNEVSYEVLIQLRYDAIQRTGDSFQAVPAYFAINPRTNTIHIWPEGLA